MKWVRLAVLAVLGMGAAIAAARCPATTDLSWTPEQPVAGEDVRFLLSMTQAVITLAFVEVVDGEIRLRTLTDSTQAGIPPFHAVTLEAHDLAAGNYEVVWDNFWIDAAGGQQCPLVHWPLTVAGAPTPAVPAPLPWVTWPLLLAIGAGGLRALRRHRRTTAS